MCYEYQLLWIRPILCYSPETGGKSIKGRKKGAKGGKEVRARINDQITEKEVRVINADGEQVGILPIDEAQEMADETGLDLVEVSPTAKPAEWRRTFAEPTAASSRRSPI